MRTAIALAAIQYFVLHVEHPSKGADAPLILLVANIAFAQDLKELYDWWKK
jgi:hypothetical protein